MIKYLNFALGLLLIASVCLSFCACSSESYEKGLWENATYTEDTEFGIGATTNGSYIMGGSGGHSNTPAGTKLSMIIAHL